MAPETGFIQFDGVAIEQNVVALAATRPGCGALRGNSIGGAAVGADDMQGVVHVHSSGGGIATHMVPALPNKRARSVRDGRTMGSIRMDHAASP
jgi:hypothetical protein